MLTIFFVALLFTIGRCRADQNFLTRTVHVGDDVTLTCSRQSSQLETGTLFWIRLTAGNLPEVLGATYTFDSIYINKTPRITAKQEPQTFVLHITKTELSDTAFYYCEKHVELQTTFLNITFLRVKGTEPDITTVIPISPSEPVHPGDSVTLQCSVLSDSEKKTCPGDHRVYWFRAGSDGSHHSVIYVHGEKCERNPGALSPQICVYNFSRNNVISSDAGTYYCAVATCGEILFGNGTKLVIEDGTKLDIEANINTVPLLLLAALALSLIFIFLLIYTIKKNKSASSTAMQTNAATAMGDEQSQKTDEDSLVYSVAKFTRKPGRSLRRDTKSFEGESIYADVRVLGKE
ncbi:uncharacterized protein LOC121188455 isoform X2 [Toxotes jaculatrix]|uniref:uncharacterized protein LOC121188455 isoform X2 n=1 Tax=Toxotes jaculatrix TaxID=941984 RepID=UPI001B3A8770|nr:uncharacterized protein LOC121188455 isoform X2 [Toxotes jaculatrix]